MTEEILQLIVAQLDGSANDQQQQQFEAWLNAAPQHADDYEKIKGLWSKSASVKHLAELNTAKDWQSTRRKIGFGKKTRVGTWAVAASVALLLGIAAVLQYISTQPTVYLADGEITTITLDDGSEIVLNKGASIEVAHDFGKTTRSLVLDGEAFFEVAKDPSKPFHIDAKNTHTQVLGTAFNIDASSEKTAIQVDHGLVKFSTRRASVKLREMMGAISATDGSIEEVTADPNAFAWRTGILTFHNTELAEAVRVLNDHYEVNIQLSITDELSITSTFDNQSLEEVLDEICLIHGLAWQTTSQGYKIQ